MMRGKRTSYPNLTAYSQSVFCIKRFLAPAIIVILPEGYSLFREWSEDANMPPR